MLPVNMYVHRRTLSLLLWLLLVLAACQPQAETFIAPAASATPPSNAPAVSTATEPSPSATTPPATATPIPPALVVNQEAVSLAEYQAALERFQRAQPDVPVEEARQAVLDELIEQLLLAQAAAESGFVVEDTLLEERIEALTTQVGGEQALAAWLSENGYTEESFRHELARAIAAAWMRDQIIATVPETAEQVHARQLLLSSLAEAQRVYNQLQSGSDFNVMLVYYDPAGLGDLGWFPRGYLEQQAIEEAAFALEPGEISEVIETPLGFHILQVIERLPDRPLDPDAKLVLQSKALDAWLQERRGESEISILVP